MSILSTLFEYIEKFIPFRIIHSYQKGVRWTLGSPGPILTKGIHFFIPGFQSIDYLPTTLSPAQFEIDFLTMDAYECTARIGMEYRVTDIIKLYSTVQDGEIVEGLPTLSVIASGLANGVLSSQLYPELWNDKERIEEEMTDECNAEFHKRGLDIVDMKICSIKKTVGYKIFLSQSPKIITEIME